jgi:hypothetical protein
MLIAERKNLRARPGSLRHDGGADAIEMGRGSRFKKRILLGVRWLALGCILLLGK